MAPGSLYISRISFNAARYTRYVAHFTYTAEKSGGEVYKGVAEARDRFELYSVVRREGGKILSVTEERSDSIWSLRYWNMQLAAVGEYDRILFSRNLGAMLSAGLSLARALSVIERQTKNIKLQDTAARIASDVRRGDSLHQSLAHFPKLFSPLFVAMVKAGEESGDLSGSLALVADQMERIYDLRKKIRGALMYPSIIVIAIIGVGYLMMTKVVPTLAATFKEMNADLPASTKAVIALSDFLVGNVLLSAGVFVGLVVAGVALARTALGRRARDWFFLRIPVIGNLVREANAARTSRTLSSLLSAGVDVLSALAIVREVVQNSYFREVIADAERRVGAGEPLSAAFTAREDLYPAFVGEMMAVGEETGATSEMLKRLAVFYENAVDDQTRDMSTIIEPFLMVFMGLAVGFFAVSMITPIYSLTQNI